jgi:hypothetical protein
MPPGRVNDARVSERVIEEQPTADPELVTRDLSDGTRHQVVKASSTRRESPPVSMPWAGTASWKWTARTG